jgi:hypothetical protein
LWIPSRDNVVDDRLTLKVRDAKEHMWLVIDQGDHAVVERE